jgi:D-aspartate ligase
MLGIVKPTTGRMLPSLDATYPTLLLKASRDVIHHGALAVARTLGRLGVPIYAVVEDNYTPLARSRYLTRAFVWDSWPSDPESFVKAMSMIAQAIARVAIIIPMDDLSAIFVAENTISLSRWFILPPVSPQLPRQLANKVRFYALCAEIGMPFARSVIPQSIGDVQAFAEGTEFPVIVKAAEQWRLLYDGYSTKVIQTPRELFEIYKKSNRNGPSGMIIQEFIFGDNWVSHGYYNSEKNISVTFTGKKLQAYPTVAGSTALGLSLGNETLRCESERFLKAVAYSGIVDIDWRKDKRDGQYKILDCNPRVGQNFRMFENTAGIDVVRAQHLDLSGRRIDSTQMIEGRLFAVESFRLLGLLRRSPRGASKTDAGMDPPPKGRELAWWSRDDRLPFFVMSMRLLIHVLRRAFRRLENITFRQGQS